MCKVSFIVPVCNGEKTIERCLESILNQEDVSIDYEVLVVNDGSIDHTIDVLEKYIEKYKDKIRIINKENGGLSDARNAGMKEAKGNYFIFVDGDDYISTTLLKDIQQYLMRDFDLVKWSPLWVNDKGEKIKDADKNNYLETSGEVGFNNLFGSDVLFTCVWNYAIKKDLMIEFPVGKYHEDFAIMSLIMLKAKYFVITGKVEYYYVQTDSSIMRGNDSKKQLKRLEDILSHYDNIYKESELLKIRKNTKENLRIYITNALLASLRDLSGENREFFIKELKKRKIYKNIKCRNIKQLIKRILLMIKY